MKFLNETLIAVGISLLAYGFNAPWAAYSEAELKEIDAHYEANRFSQAYGEFSKKVNEQINSFNSCIEAGDKCDKETVRDSILSESVKVAELNKNSENAGNEANRAIKLAFHYRTMKRIWFAVGVLSLLIGVALTSVGVRGALRSRGS